MAFLLLTDKARQRLVEIPVSRRPKVAGSAFHIATSRGAQKIQLADVVAADRQAL